MAVRCGRVFCPRALEARTEKLSNKVLGTGRDIGASVVGALATLPQAVAYGLIAFGPLGAEWAAYGILASVGSAILFGSLTGALATSKFLISGPNVVAALVYSVGIQTALSRGYEPLDAIFMGFCGVIVSGIFQFIAGVLRLGYAVSYMPVPVLAGFVNASAILVMISSLPMVLGLPGVSVVDIVTGEISNAGVWASVVGSVTIVLTFLLEGRLRIIPAALAGLLVGAGVYHAGIQLWGQASGPTVGHIDLRALLQTPVMMSSNISLEALIADIDIPLLTGISIGLLNSFTSILCASALDMRVGTQSDPNKDLRIHGAANILMGLVGYLPGCGTLNRSSAIISAGAKTRAANVGSSIAFLLMLLLLAPFIAQLPLWASSGMLLATAIQAIDKQTLVKLWRVVRRDIPYPRVLAGDLLVIFAVVVTALIFNLIFAIGVGMLLAVFLFVLGMGRDPVRRIYDAAHVPSKVQRSSAQQNFLEREGARIVVIEMQGAIFFGTCARLQNQTKRLINAGAEFLILDFRHVSSIDSTGTALLRTLGVACQEAGGKLLLSNVEPERRLDQKYRIKFRNEQPNDSAPSKTSLRWIWLNMHANGVLTAIGQENIFDDTDLALTSCEDALIDRFGKTGEVGTRGIVVNSAVFSGLNRGQVIALGRYTKRHFFEDGDIVFEQGDVGDSAYFLVRGRMDVSIEIPGSNRKKRVSSLAEGTLFAEMALIDGDARSAGIIAIRNSCCFSIDAGQFQRLQDEMPDIALQLLRNVSHEFANRLRLANKMIAELEQ